MTLFKEGDPYIHFTKYGGTNRGFVKSLGFISCVNLREREYYKKHWIITTNEIMLMLDGSDGRIYKIENHEFIKPA